MAAKFRLLSPQGRFKESGRQRRSHSIFVTLNNIIRLLFADINQNRLHRKAVNQNCPRCSPFGVLFFYYIFPYFIT